MRTALDIVIVILILLVFASIFLTGCSHREHKGKDSTRTEFEMLKK